MKHFDSNKLPHHGRFAAYQKRGPVDDSQPILAAHVKGRFVLRTRDGERGCSDAYVLTDAEGHPYAIDREAFERTYQRVPNC